MSKSILLIAIATLAMSPCLAEELPENVQKFLKDSVALRPETTARFEKRLAEGEQRLAAAKRGKVQKGSASGSRQPGAYSYTFRTAEAKKEKVDQIAESLSNLKTAIKDLKSGQGYPIFELNMPVVPGKFGSSRLTLTVVQVVDDKNCLVNFAGTENTWWLTGVSTNGLTDGRKTYLGEEDGIFYVDGTKRYTSVGGGVRTIPLLRPFSRGDIEKSFKDGERLIPNLDIER